MIIRQKRIRPAEVPGTTQHSHPAHIRRGRRFIKVVGGTLFLRILLRLTVVGAEHIPRSGPAIVLINHVSLLDPIPVTGASMHIRDVVPVGKQELYEHWFTRWVMNTWGCIPIRRGEADIDALRRALTALRGPDMLLVAPEGTRNPDGLKAPKDGVAFLAHKSGATIIPTGMSGTSGFDQHWKRLRRAPITLRYGRPVRIRPAVKRADYPKIMEELMYQIAALVPPHLRGDYTDLSKATMTTIEYVENMEHIGNVGPGLLSPSAAQPEKP